MSKLSRRDFIRGSMAVGAGMALATPFSRARGANDAIRLAVVGVGGQGSGHCKYFNAIDGVRLVAVCDPDQKHIDRRVEDYKKQGQTIKGYMDVRELLEDKGIDVITSATPNHWHSLVTIWACQAGKDVYIEKPVSHEIWEGRKMVEAARKYNRIVQTGTQKRSDLGLVEAYKYIKEGKLGEIKWSRGFCYKARFEGTNGIVNGTNGPNPLPDSIDYNLWCGPAEMEPLRRESLHYKWHWIWNSGNGDLGNQGIHEMDLARWALGDPSQLAPGVVSFGGRFRVNDAGETANTQVIYLDYKPAPLIFEVRGLPVAKGRKDMPNYRGIRVGMVVQCEDGYFAGGAGGGWVYDNEGNRIKQFKGQGGEGHHQNFIKAVRSRKVSDLNADIEKGHYSSALCHMGNISYRLGKKMPVSEVKNTISDNADLMDSFERMVEHLKVNEVDLEKEPITMGPMLTMNPQKEKFIGENSRLANMFVKRNYREPF
ncbi:MAG: Gfo/Idh/MocA family oxidoreductase, partial [Planctomycetota bacterium]|nr:Gfo/Idh/MocA family oxidoreductase [Planctomycetota bacterium]